jgi:hypothetical protein
MPDGGPPGELGVDLKSVLELDCRFLDIAFF